MKKINWKMLLFYILLPMVLSFVIMLILPSYKEYYNGLKKPFKLSSMIFPIVWNTIFILVGIATYLVYKEKGNNKEIKVYYLQVFFNVTWSIMFFGFKKQVLSLIWLFILFLIVIKMFIDYYKVNKKAGYMIIPYLLWLSFASYLSIYILINN